VGGVIAAGNRSEAIGPTSLPVNTWTYLAATYDGAAVRLYVNGSLASSTPTSGAILTSSNPLQIGGDSIHAHFFSALTDEVRTHEGPLSEAQIQADMATPVPDTVPPTAPSNLSATASSANQVNLSWTASSDNVGVTGYLIDRMNPGSTTFTQVAI